MKKILVLTDFSENSVNAYKYAVHLACEIKATILLVFCSNGKEISTTDQLYYSQKLHSFASRFACSSRIKTNPNHTECQVISGLWANTVTGIIQNNTPDLLVAGSDLLAHFKKGTEMLKMEQFSICPIIWVPENAAHHNLKNLVFVTDFTDQDPAVIETVKAMLERFQASVSLLHFYAKADRSRLTEIKKAGEHLDRVFGERCRAFYMVEEEDMVEGMEDFAAKYMIDLFILATRDSHLADQYFRPVYRKTNGCQTAIPLLNLYQDKKKPCAGSCEYCYHPEEEKLAMAE